MEARAKNATSRIEWCRSVSAYNLCSTRNHTDANRKKTPTHQQRSLQAARQTGGTLLAGQEGHPRCHRVVVEQRGPSFACTAAGHSSCQAATLRVPQTIMSVTRSTDLEATRRHAQAGVTFVNDGQLQETAGACGERGWPARACPRRLRLFKAIARSRAGANGSLRFSFCLHFLLCFPRPPFSSHTANVSALAEGTSPPPPRAGPWSVSRRSR